MKKEYEFYSLGMGGKSIIKIDGNTLTISRPGLMSKMSLGFTGDKTIMINQISGVQIKKVGLARGYIQFIMAGNKETKSGIIGGKTGYTSLAGNTLVTCAERDGLKLIAVVLNGRQTHYSDTKALLDFGFENFKSVLIADQDSTYQEIENDLAIGGIFSGETIKLTVDTNSAITLPMNGNFADVTSSLDYTLDETAPKSAVARIDYKYGERIVGQAYLEASTIPEYVIKESVEEVVPSTEAIKPTATPIKKNDSTISVFDILKKILTVGAVIGVVGMIILGVIIYREKQEERAMTIRRQNRERRRKEWGATTEFNLVMQEHLRSKNQFKKRSLWDKIKNWFRR